MANQNSAFKKATFFKHALDWGFVLQSEDNVALSLFLDEKSVQIVERVIIRHVYTIC